MIFHKRFYIGYVSAIRSFLEHSGKLVRETSYHFNFYNKCSGILQFFWNGVANIRGIAVIVLGTNNKQFFHMVTHVFD